MANGPERLLWEQIRAGMGYAWHCQRHEDRFTVGIPDVSFGIGGRDGWMELKSIAKPPRDPSAPFDIPGLSVAQRNWMNVRIAHGAPDRCFVFVRVEEPRAYVLHRWDRLRNYLGKRSYRVFTGKALGFWMGSVSWAHFAEALSNPSGGDDAV